MRFKQKLAACAAAIGLCVSLWPATALAAAGEIYISPGSTSVRMGTEFTVGLWINPGTAVDSVQATVGYSTADLDFISSSLGAFPTCVQDSGGGGTVTFACAKLGGTVSSTSLIADITFKALAGSGSTSLSVSNANAAHAGVYTNPSSSGGTVSFTSPPASTKKSSSSSSSHTTQSPSAAKSTTSATPSSLTDTTQTSTRSSTTKKSTKTVTKTSAPTVTLANLAATNVQFSTATIMLSANSPVSMLAQYGTNKNSLNLSTPLSPAGKTANVNLTQLVPATTYYYQGVAKDSHGNTLVTTSIKSFTTEGYTVKVTVLDSKYHPIVGKVVTLHSTPMQAKTNSQGIATFTGVAPGLHHADYTVGRHTYSQTVYVANNFTTKDNAESAAPQSAAVVLSGYVQPNSSSPAVIWLALLFVVIVAVLVVARKRTLTLLNAARKQAAKGLKHGKDPNVL